MQRNEYLTDLVAAIEARIKELCPSLAAVSRSQATNYAQLAALIARQYLTPAAIVIPGAWTVEDDLAIHANDYRLVAVGILVVADFSASEDGGTYDFWTALDELHDAHTPIEERGEDERYPVSVLGDQTGDARGVLLKPAGLELVDAGENRCAAIYQLTVIDPIAERH